MGLDLSGQGNEDAFVNSLLSNAIETVKFSRPYNNWKICLIKHAIFRALIRDNGTMVAAMASIPEGKARFFIVQKQESPDNFIGRVSAWIKEQGAAGLDMQPPDILPQGTIKGEILMRLTSALGASKEDQDAPEFDVKNPYEWYQDDKSKLVQ